MFTGTVQKEGATQSRRPMRPPRGGLGDESANETPARKRILFFLFGGQAERSNAFK